MKIKCFVGRDCLHGLNSLVVGSQMNSDPLLFGSFSLKSYFLGEKRAGTVRNLNFHIVYSLFSPPLYESALWLCDLFAQEDRASGKEP